MPSELVALSNMPVIEEKQNGPLKTVYFQESPIMSTYLVAVVVGMFDYVEAQSTDGMLFVKFGYNLFTQRTFNLSIIICSNCYCYLRFR